MDLQQSKGKSPDLSTTTSDLHLHGTDVQATMFDRAAIVPFWLRPTGESVWDEAPWEKHCMTDRSKIESKAGGIQNIWNDNFILNHTSSLWRFADTHKGFEKTTQDCLMHLADRPASPVSVGLVIELVGQNETGYPSKEHKAKFIRDMMRVHQRRGWAGHLFGALTDGSISPRVLQAAGRRRGLCC